MWTLTTIAAVDADIFLDPDKGVSDDTLAPILALCHHDNAPYCRPDDTRLRWSYSSHADSIVGRGGGWTPMGNNQGINQDGELPRRIKLLHTYPVCRIEVSVTEYGETPPEVTDAVAWDALDIPTLKDMRFSAYPRSLPAVGRVLLNLSHQPFELSDRVDLAAHSALVPAFALL
jgi:hypothetical protein